MSLRRALSRSIGAALATIAVLPAVAVMAPVSYAVAAPPYTLEERALAIAQPSVFALESRFEGFLRYKDSGATILTQASTITIRCSGFAIAGDGTAVTASHCIQPDEYTLTYVGATAVVASLVKDGKLAKEQADAYVTGLLSKTHFTGATADAPPQQAIVVRSGNTAGLLDSETITAEIVKARPVQDLDLGVIKLSRPKFPALELRADGANGSTVVYALGLTSVSSDGNGPFSLISRKSSITGKDENSVPPTYIMDGELSHLATGGPVIDESGRAVGMINANTQTDAVNRLIFDSTVVSDALRQAGRNPGLGDADKTYRAGLDAYFGGRYSEAITDFDKVLAAQPAHAFAAAYRAKAAERLAIEGEPAGVPIWLVALLVVVIVLIIVVIVALIVMRRRPDRQPETETLMPISLNPFASPTSGIPISGGGGGYPTASYPVLQPQPAPPGMPVPHPPQVNPPQPLSTQPVAIPVDPFANPVPQQPVSPASVSPAAPAAVSPAAPAAPTSQPEPEPAPVPPPSQPQPQPQPQPGPVFSWPEDDVASTGDMPPNPWAPAPQRSDERS